MYAGKENVVEVSLIDEQGNVIGEREIFIKTESLPKELSSAIKVRKKSELSAMSFIMVTGGHEITTCVFDALGEIRYYLFPDGGGEVSLYRKIYCFAFLLCSAGGTVL